MAPSKLVFHSNREAIISEATFLRLRDVCTACHLSDIGLNLMKSRPIDAIIIQNIYKLYGCNYEM